MRHIALLGLVVFGLLVVIGCGKDDSPPTVEQTREIVAEKVDQINAYLAEQDIEKAEAKLAELKDMLADASEDARAAIGKAIDTAEKAIEAAKAKDKGDSLLKTLTGDGD